MKVLQKLEIKYFFIAYCINSDFAFYLFQSQTQISCTSHEINSWKTMKMEQPVPDEVTVIGNSGFFFIIFIAAWLV